MNNLRNSVMVLAACGSITVAANAQSIAPASAPGVPMVAIDAELNTRAVRVLGIESIAASETTPSGLAVRLMNEGREELVPLASSSVGPTSIIALAPAWWGSASADAGARAARPIAAKQLTSESDASRPPFGWLRLVDGQRLQGEIAGESPDPEHIVWHTEPGGRSIVLMVPIERIATIEFSHTATAASSLSTNLSKTTATAGEESAAEDVVVLINGDRVSGFVDSINSSITLEPSAGEAMQVDAQQIARIELANPLEPGMPEIKDGTPPLSTAWLSDGSVLRVMPSVKVREESPAAAVGSVTLRSMFTPPPPADAPAEVIFSLAELDSFESVTGCIRAVSDLVIAVHIPTGERRTAPPPVIDRNTQLIGGFGTRDITLDGPMQVEWTLPSGAAGVSGTLVMPRTAWAWGDCVARISIVNADSTAGQTIGEGRLNKDTPTLNFRAPIMASSAGENRLRVTIDQGERGPIQDVVIVRDAVVLVKGE